MLSCAVFLNGDSKLERNYVLWNYVMWALKISIGKHKYYKNGERKTDFNHQHLRCTNSCTAVVTLLINVTYTLHQLLHIQFDYCFV
jgi:hypothetical protein